MARHGHDQEDKQREYAENFERKAEDLAVTGVARQHCGIFVERTERKINAHHVAGMGNRQRTGQDAEMAAIIQQRQKAWIEPRQRADA